MLLGHPVAEVDAVEFRDHKAALLEVALGSLSQLRNDYDVVICEGVGSPAEINLRETDIANMGLARAAGLPVIIVGEIDRGCVFAAPPEGCRCPASAVAIRCSDARSTTRSSRAQARCPGSACCPSGSALARTSS